MFPRYLFLVTASGAVSYLLIRALAEILSMKVLWAKVAAESILFIVNFALQRDFVFAKRAESQDATDWDRYYRSVPITALLVRHYTSRVLLSCLTRIAGLRNGCAIAEFGGGNSCFLHAIRRAVQPGQYCVVDNNRYGLELLRERTAGAPDILLHCENVLSMTARLQADAAFSVGLIEHFDEESTAQAIRAHLDAVRPGGHVILSYPTPTWLYRASRFVLEVAGLWRFPDERPLKFSEVAASVADAGEVLFRKTLWPLVLTQELIVVRKRAAGTPAAASNAVSGV